MAASPQPNDDDAEVQAHVAAALDDGLGGSALLSRLHEAKPSLNMEAMQAALKTAQKTEDARLFDLIAENYRDFFSLAQSLDTSAELDGAVDFVRDGALVGRLARCRRVGGGRAQARAPPRRPSSRPASATRARPTAPRGAACSAPAAPWASARGSRRFARARALAAFLAAAFTQGRLDGVERGSCSGLATIFRATLEFVAERAGPALAAAEAAARGDGAEAKRRRRTRRSRTGAAAPAPRTGASTASIWCATASGRPSAPRSAASTASSTWGTRATGADLRVCAASAKFADDLAALAASGDRALARRVRRRLKAHPATATLEERWNLPVYFELVRGDLVRDLDDALAATYVLVDGPRRGPPEVSDRVASALGVVARTWAPDAVLAPSGDKFAGLAFELVGLVVGDAARRLGDATADWPPRRLGQLAFDLDAARRRRRRPIGRGLRGVAGPGPGHGGRRRGGRAGGPGAGPAAPGGGGGAARGGASRAGGRPAQRVKGVPATYHLTGKPPPGAPSRYVSDALAPGAAFAGDWGGHLADAQGRFSAAARRQRRASRARVEVGRELRVVFARLRRRARARAPASAAAVASSWPRKAFAAAAAAAAASGDRDFTLTALSAASSARRDLGLDELADDALELLLEGAAPRALVEEPLARRVELARERGRGRVADGRVPLGASGPRPSRSGRAAATPRVRPERRRERPLRPAGVRRGRRRGGGEHAVEPERRGRERRDGRGLATARVEVAPSARRAAARSAPLARRAPPLGAGVAAGFGLSALRGPSSAARRSASAALSAASSAATPSKSASRASRSAAKARRGAPPARRREPRDLGRERGALGRPLDRDGGRAARDDASAPSRSRSTSACSLEVLAVTRPARRPPRRRRAAARARGRELAAERRDDGVLRDAPVPVRGGRRRELRAQRAPCAAADRRVAASPPAPPRRPR
ncbi:component of oligomeric golgi complex [Aureococcus anophagefferens]|uniref:Component of oligomeric golgi complex n=1 Tax=Aureococcus anophagefferens TaxID=44056 RepID=A0ABR1G084_AURAN